MRCLLPLFLSLCLAFPLTGHAEDDERPIVRLGLMAFTHEDSYTTHNQEDDFILKTLPSLLAQVLPEYHIETHVYRTYELVNAAKKEDVDIVFGSSGCYASLLPNGIYPLGTLVTNRSPDPNHAVAGALIVRTDRTDLQTVADLKGRVAIGGLTPMFFNYQMPASALTDRGYDPEHFFGSLKQVDYPVKKVLTAIKDGTAEVGMIRACTLEELPPEEQTYFRVIEPVKNSPLRCAHTSRTFANWTVGAMKHVPSDVASRISASLLTMPPQTDAGIRWSIANSFSNIDDLYKALKFGRYDYLRHWTLERFWHIAWPFVLAGIVALCALLLHLQRVQHLVDKRTEELRSEMKRRELLERQNAAIADKFHRLERTSTLGTISNMVAHELRQPLSALRYALRTIEMFNDKETRSPLLTRATDAARRQSDRIGAILDHVRSYARSENLSESVNPADVIEECLAEAIQTGILPSRPATHLERDLRVKANRLELQLVVFNLLKNSSEATEGRDPHISIRLTKDASGVLLVISDQAKRLTDEDTLAFGTPTHSDKTNGLGLGLSIVRTIVESHAGSIHFTPRVPKGLSVSIIFPEEADES